MTLTEMCLEITSECPMHCNYCSNNYQKKDVMDTMRVFEIIDEFVDMGGKILEFSGGEPMTHPNVKAFIIYAKYFGVETRLYSSGNFDNQAREILDLAEKGLDKIYFNVEGPNSGIHDLITGVEGSYQKAMKAIDISTANGIYTGVHIVPTQYNYLSIANMVTHLEGKVQEIALLNFVAQGRGETNKSKLALTDSQLLRLMTDIEEIRMSKISCLRLGHPFQHLLSNGQHFECPSGSSTCLVKANGDVVPCPAFKGLPVGNINDKSLKDIFENSEQLKAIRNRKVKNPMCMVGK